MIYFSFSKSVLGGLVTCTSVKHIWSQLNILSSHILWILQHSSNFCHQERQQSALVSLFGGKFEIVVPNFTTRSASVILKKREMQFQFSPLGAPVDSASVIFGGKFEIVVPIFTTRSVGVVFKKSSVRLSKNLAKNGTLARSGRFTLQKFWENFQSILKIFHFGGN